MTNTSSQTPVILVQSSKTASRLCTFRKNFLLCGSIGWCMEICFTALHSLQKQDMQLMGKTSLWMFPIYGCAAFIAPISRLLRHKPIWLRGLTYMGLIFSAEFLSGSILSHYNLCPWDYSHSSWNINKVIRLDYAPYWFGAGLLFERVLSPAASANIRSS